MPDIGYQSAAGDGDQSATVLRGNVITMAEDGDEGVTLTFRLLDNAGTPGDSVKAAVFAADESLIAESDVRTDIAAEGEYTFSGGGLDTFAPANGVTYYICVIASSTTVRSVFDDIASPNGTQVTDQDSSTFGPPVAFSAFGAFLNDARSTIGYMTYTTGGGEPEPPATLPESRKFGPRGFVRTLVNL